MHSVCTTECTRTLLSYLAWWWFLWTETRLRIFNIDHHIYCSVIYWNKLLYYYNTQRDDSYQNNCTISSNIYAFGCTSLKNPHFSAWNSTQEFFMLHRHDISIQGTCKEAIKIADLIPNVCATFLLPHTFAQFSWYSHPKWEVKAYVSYFSKMDSRRMEWWGIFMVPGSIYCFPLKLAVKFWNLRQNYSCAQRHVNPSRSASQGANTSYRTRFIHYIRSNCHSRQHVYIYIGLATPP